MIIVVLTSFPSRQMICKIYNHDWLKKYPHAGTWKCKRCGKRRRARK